MANSKFTYRFEADDKKSGFTVAELEAALGQFRKADIQDAAIKVEATIWGRIKVVEFIPKGQL